jgi:stress-induced morphogen
MHAACLASTCRLQVVSDAFGGLGPVKRHQLVYGLLSEEFAAGLHALSMDLKTPAEAEQKQ